MNRVTTTSIIAVSVMANLSACSTPTPAPDETAPVPSQAVVESFIYEACTLIGNDEYVSVDFSEVLDSDGGDYYASISVNGVFASEIPGFAGNDFYGRYALVNVDLSSGPTRVDVIVRSTNGADGDSATATEVYRASGDLTPELHQPNGAACDGENYRAAAKATVSGGLVMVPAE